jgi:hypothetical protein
MNAMIVIVYSEASKLSTNTSAPPQLYGLETSQIRCAMGDSNAGCGELI